MKHLYFILNLFLRNFALKVDAVQDLRGILTRIGRFKSLEVQYTKIHVKPLKKLWEDFDLKQRANRIEMEKRGGEIISTSFSSWLPSFYDETILYLEQEWNWYVHVILFSLVLNF